MDSKTYNCSSCRNFTTTDLEEFMLHRDTCDGTYTRDVGWGSGALRYNANAAIAVLTVLLALLTAKPSFAQAPEPMPNALTAIFFHDANKNGALDSNESMAAGVDLTFTETHVDGTAIAATGKSDANGYFATTMQPCPCTWLLKANGETFSGSVETWTGYVYVSVAIKKYNTFLPLINN